MPNSWHNAPSGIDINYINYTYWMFLEYNFTKLFTITMAHYYSKANANVPTTPGLSIAFETKKWSEFLI